MFWALFAFSMAVGSCGAESPAARPETPDPALPDPGTGGSPKPTAPATSPVTTRDMFAPPTPEGTTATPPAPPGSPAPSPSTPDAGSRVARAPDAGDSVPITPTTPIAEGDSMKFFPTTFAPGHSSSCWIETSGKIRCKGGGGTDCCESNGGSRVRVPTKYAETKFKVIANTHLTTCGIFQEPIGDKSFDCWGGPVADVARPVAKAVVQIGLGDNHGCIRQSDGLMKCWGQGGNSVPDGLKAKFLAVGPSMNCAIGLDDLVVCWGSKMVAPPAGLKAKYLTVHSEQEPVDSGMAHLRPPVACAVDMNDDVQCWGSTNLSSVKNRPAGLKVRSVSVGIVYGCAVRVNGTGICWGQKTSELGPVRQVAANYWIACALDEHNLVKCPSANVGREPPNNVEMLAPPGF